ncbi:MAG: hypothetical protein ABIP92_12920 [Arthrobacter sp.]
MASPFLSAPFALWQFLALAAVVVIAAGASVYLVRKHKAAEDGLPDAVFWDAFAGLAVAVPAVILPALAAPWAGLLLAILAAAAAAASYLGTPGIVEKTAARRFARETAGRNELAAARHRSALARWQRYELDPAHCIDYPAMSDPRQPETAVLIRAIKAAELLRGGTDPGYAPAVARLEQALAEAERAAGVQQTAPVRTAALVTADPVLG